MHTTANLAAFLCSYKFKIANLFEAVCVDSILLWRTWQQDVSLSYSKCLNLLITVLGLEEIFLCRKTLTVLALLMVAICLTYPFPACQLQLQVHQCVAIASYMCLTEEATLSYNREFIALVILISLHLSGLATHHLPFISPELECWGLLVKL